jgi:transposase
VLDERIGAYQKRIEQHARTDERARRLQALTGVGAISASAIVASVQDAREFDNGRQFAAWLGLTPKQHSTGGKARLGHITRYGDPYLRTLLIMGARSTLHNAGRREDRLSRWASSVRARRGYHRASVAIAAKHARIIWAMLARGQPLRRA